MSQDSQLEVFEYFLKPGFILANADDSVVRAVLGNCVAVTIYDRENRFGGVNHFLFPSTDKRAQATAKYGNIAIHTLYRLLMDMGAAPHAVEAQIIGGAIRDGHFDNGLGMKNVEVARNVLRRLNVPVASEDIGGSRGRKLIYHTGTNETIIYKVDNIRDSDWFLPGQDIRFTSAR